MNVVDGDHALGQESKAEHTIEALAVRAVDALEWDDTDAHTLVLKGAHREFHVIGKRNECGPVAGACVSPLTQFDERQLEFFRTVAVDNIVTGCRVEDEVQRLRSIYAHIEPDDPFHHAEGYLDSAVGLWLGSLAERALSQEQNRKKSGDWLAHRYYPLTNVFFVSRGIKDVENGQKRQEQAIVLNTTDHGSFRNLL